MFTTKASLGFDPQSIIASAKERLDRGDIALDELPTLALAHARVSGALEERLQPFAYLWARLPAGVVPEELGETFRVARELGSARARLFSLRAGTMTERAQREAARERLVKGEFQALASRRAGGGALDLSGAELEAEARRRVTQQELDEQRVAAAQIAGLERQLEDQIRLAFAGARKG